MGGDDDAAAQQRHRLGRESGCRQEKFSRGFVGAALARPGGRAEPEVELPVRAGQTLQSTVVDELGEIGLAVGLGLIGGAIGVEVQDSVHSDVPFNSFVAVDRGGNIHHCY
jgi:hypothetical protein